MWKDLQHGFVLLRREVGVSTLIILVLALGIGGNAAIFTLLKAAFLDPLPYRDAGRLVTIMENNGWIPSTAEFVEIRARSRSFDQFAFAEHRDSGRLRERQSLEEVGILLAGKTGRQHRSGGQGALERARAGEGGAGIQRAAGIVDVSGRVHRDGVAEVLTDTAPQNRAGWIPLYSGNA